MNCPMVECRSLSHKRIIPRTWRTTDGVFYGEKIFQELLLLEKKRTTRSGHPFILARINISHMPCHTAHRGCIRLLISQLHTLTRETDLKGWYSHENELGIIFTEIGTADDPLAVRIITGKLRNAIFNAIGPHCGNTITVTLQCITEPGRDIPDYNVYPEGGGETAHHQVHVTGIRIAGTGASREVRQDIQSVEIQDNGDWRHSTMPPRHRTRSGNHSDRSTAEGNASRQAAAVHQWAEG